MSQPIVRPPVEIVELTDQEPAAVWGRYRDSGMVELIQGFNLCHALAGFVESGMAARLERGDWVDRDAVIEGMVERFADPFLRYLAVHSVVEGGDRVRLTERGRALVEAVPAAQLGFYHAAYSHVLSRIPGLLLGTDTYGATVERDAAALGRHCATIVRAFFTSILLTALSSAGASHVLDLGCGAGQLVIDACLAQPELRAVGLDISPAAIDVARREASRQGVDDRVRFVVADAFLPDTWPAECADADAMCAVGVLHEHFRAGDQAVVEILDAYAGLFERGLKTFVLGEPEILYDLENNDSDLFLVHIFTDQGIPRRREGWLDVIGRTRLRCRQVFTRPASVPRFAFYDLALA